MWTVGQGDAILPLCLSLLRELLRHRMAADRPGTKQLQTEETPPAYIIGKHCRKEKLTLLWKQEEVQTPFHKPNSSWSGGGSCLSCVGVLQDQNRQSGLLRGAPSGDVVRRWTCVGCTVLFCFWSFQIRWPLARTWFDLWSPLFDPPVPHLSHSAALSNHMRGQFLLSHMLLVFPCQTASAQSPLKYFGDVTCVCGGVLLHVLWIKRFESIQYFSSSSLFGTFRTCWTFLIW